MDTTFITCQTSHVLPTVERGSMDGLYARHAGGDFLLRIEDTDLNAVRSGTRRS